jgi:hypothetical protein
VGRDLGRTHGHSHLPEEQAPGPDWLQRFGNRAPGGVAASPTRRGGTIHDFMMLDATRNTHGAQSATAEAIEFIRDHLGT